MILKRDPVNTAIGLLTEPYFVGLTEPNGTVVNITAIRRAVGGGHRVPSGFRRAILKRYTYTPIKLPEWRDPTND